MSQTYICENMNKCTGSANCVLAYPHEFQKGGCDHGMNSSRKGCIRGSKCVPTVEAAVSALGETTLDSDIAVARLYASNNNIVSNIGVRELLMRLADRLESNSKL